MPAVSTARLIRASAALLLVACACGVSRAQDVPFAQTVTPAQTSAGLSETMLSIAQRHAILWFAGHAGNWGLTAYEIGQLRARFIEAGSAYRNIPIEVIVPMTKSLDALQASAERKDSAAFSKAFDAATRACNACHSAAGLNFLQVRRPAAAPLANIEWAPARAPH